MRFALPSLLAATLLASGSALAQTGNAPAPAKPAAPATDAAKAKPEVKPLSIGDAAPALDIEHFVKGEPFKGFEAGKITVVEFWATWCSPCKAAFPHISELQERYKDYGVTVVGISDEKLEKVKPFIETPEWNEKMRYTVATDPDRSVYSSYMTAAGQNGIPTAFLVGKKGTVEWIGHPMNLDGVLEDVVKDRWDATAAKKKFEEDRAAEQEMLRNSMKLREAQAAGNWDEVIKLLDGMIEKSPENDRLLMQKMQICLASGNRPAEGYAIARRLFERGAKNATMLNQIAWTIVDPAAPVKERDTKFATEVAEKAVEITGGKDGAVLDTLARCYWLAGDKAKAIETQKKAVEAGGPMKADLEKTLAEYESAK